MKVGDFLKPPSPTRESAPPTQANAADRSRDALNYPKAPVAGFWRRAGALAFDFFVIYWSFRCLGWLAPGALLALGTRAPGLGAALILAYFVLGTGPVGRGRTIGKLLVGVRVVGPDGKPPSLARAALRTAILYPGLILGFFICPWIFDNETYDGNLYSSILADFPMIGLLVGTIIAIVFNPFKQGLHDFAAKTLVQPASIDPLRFEQVTEIIGGQWQRFHKQAAINGTATAILITALLATLAIQQMKDSPRRESFHTTRALVREHFDPRVSVGIQGLYPAAADPMDRSTLTPEITEAFITAMKDKTSSTTLQIAVRLDRQGPWGATVEDAAFHAKIEKFAGDYRNSHFLENWDENAAALNLYGRPLILRVYVREVAYLMFWQVVSKELGNLKLSYPPLEGRPIPAPAAGS